MLDGEVPEKVEMVWGFAVQTRSGGRRKWPAALRAMAVERIAAGEGIREIAEEIGANKSLVAVWVKNVRPEDPVPAFFEVVPPSLEKPCRTEPVTLAPENAAPSCRISIGDDDIAMPPVYPADHLAEVLRAVRASQ